MAIRFQHRVYLIMDYNAEWSSLLSSRATALKQRMRNAIGLIRYEPICGRHLFEQGLDTIVLVYNRIWYSPFAKFGPGLRSAIIVHAIRILVGTSSQACFASVGKLIKVHRHRKRGHVVAMLAYEVVMIVKMDHHGKIVGGIKIHIANQSPRHN